MQTEILEEIGLTKSEIHVYVAMLELGSTTTGKIVAKSKATSSKIYEILDRLIEKGLASYIIKSGVKYFEAASPERIMDYMDEKEKKFNLQKNKLKQIIPELEIKKQLSKYKSEATIYKGIKGVESAYADSLKLLKPGDELLVIAAHARSEQLKRFYIRFQKERAKRQIKQKIIFNDEIKGQSHTTQETNKLSEIKFVPKTTPASFDIFNDRVIIFPESEEILLIVIDSKEVAESFRIQFEMLWNQDTTVNKGFKALEHSIYDLFDDIGSNGTYDVMGAAFGIKGFEKKYAEFFRNIHKKRFQKGIPARLLFQQGTDTIIQKYRKDIYKENAKVKFLPYKDESPVATFISNNKTLLVIQKEEPIVVTLNNKDIANSFKRHFETLWNQDTVTYKGENGVKTFFDKLLKHKDIWWIGGNFGIKKYFPRYWESYKIKRVQSKSFWHDLIDTDMMSREDLTDSSFYEFKMMPSELKSPHVICIYGNTVANIIWAGQNTTIFEFTNKNIAKSHKNYFDHLWNQETRVVKGLDAIQNIFDEILEAGSCDLIGARGYFVDHRPKYIDIWEKKAVESGFKMRNIVDPETKGHRITKFPFAKTKYTLEKEFTKLSVFWIYANKVVISNWTKDEPIAIIIEKQEVYDMYKQQFELLWRKKS